MPSPSAALVEAFWFLLYIKLAMVYWGIVFEVINHVQIYGKEIAL